MSSKSIYLSSFFSLFFFWSSFSHFCLVLLPPRWMNTAAGCCAVRQTREPVRHHIFETGFIQLYADYVLHCSHHPCTLPPFHVELQKPLRKRVFAAVTDGIQAQQDPASKRWQCCGRMAPESKDQLRHIATAHRHCIDEVCLLSSPQPFIYSINITPMAFSKLCFPCVSGILLHMF